MRREKSATEGGGAIVRQRTHTGARDTWKESLGARVDDRVSLIAPDDIVSAEREAEGVAEPQGTLFSSFAPARCPRTNPPP